MMEDEAPNSILKTPRRTRRTSVQENETAELNSLSVSKKNPTTPGRSTRTLEFRTPSRLETAAAAVQTPRRSCRKSIKPIQEYENIVAQKGLSVKRLIQADSTTSKEVEEETPSGVELVRENKWTPADIGRVSTKRSKKKRNKKKRLERQKNIEEVKEVENEQGTKSDNDVDDIVLDDKNDEINADELTKIEENSIAKEEDNHEIETSPKDVPTIDIQNVKNNTVESDDSMEEGDVILNAMPITGDDCMQSPVKPLNQDLITSVSATPVGESAESSNKSDDSDCIMLSLNESSHSRQSVCKNSSSVAVGESNFEANESSDSTGINMPPLLVCSDDEDEEEFADAHKSKELPIDKELCQNNNSDPLNGTFNADENIEKHLIDTEKSPEIEKCIDTESMGPEEIRKIVLGFEEKPEDDMTPSAPDDAEILSLNETFDADELSPKTIDTPKSLMNHSSISRNLTPFKTNMQILPDIIVEPEEEFEESSGFVFEIAATKLKSSRKRSFSFCVDRPKKNVTFHSPANKTVTMLTINHVDSSKKSTKNTPTNITKRRKRSLSVTETERDLMDYIKLKKPMHDGTPKKKVQPSRIKMPNFSNIHQKQFQRMESIADHVARRAERAKVLINSNTKMKPASVQKGYTPKNSVLRDHNKDAIKTNLSMPKARHRIDMSQLENKANNTDITNSLHTATKSRSKSKQDLRLLDDLPMVGKTPTKVVIANSSSLFKQNKITNIPKQRFNFNFNSTTLPPCGNTTVVSAPQRMHLPNPRENFNLSTAITTTRQAPKVDKLEDRRKRMMEMFKSKTSQRVGENKKEILKGVRTNRRFELQMMCRNRQN